MVNGCARFVVASSMKVEAEIGHCNFTLPLSLVMTSMGLKATLAGGAAFCAEVVSLAGMISTTPFMGRPMGSTVRSFQSFHFPP